MKKFILISLITAGMLLSFVCMIISAGFLVYQYFALVSIPSGGVLSENQSRYDVLFYDIHLEIKPDEREIDGYTGVNIESRFGALDVLELDLVENLEVTEVQDQKGRALDFTHENRKLFINPAHPLAEGEKYSVRVYYHGKPPKALLPPWSGGFNWSKDDYGNHWIGVSCQGEGAKIWFPCKDHPSDEPDSAALHITVPEDYYCASNGLLQRTDSSSGARTYHWLTRYPINNYDINISIAKYSILQRPYVSLNGDTMPVVFYYIPREGAKPDCLINMAVDMLYTYRKYYGEYPFVKEKFGLAENDYLGMEHQTLNAYGNNYHFETLNGRTFDELMLHEMGHEWWGNNITVSDWADFWIHEGICTFGEGLYHLDKTGETGYHQYMVSLKKRIRNKKPIIPKPNATEEEAYQSDIYFKGAYLIHSLRFIMTDSVFFPFLKKLATDPAHTCKNFITTDAFISSVNAACGKDQKSFIDMFLYTNDLPVIEVEYVADRRYTVRLANLNFELPVEIETCGHVQRMIISEKPLFIESSTEPVIDPQDWYLKKVIKKNIPS